MSRTLRPLVAFALVALISLISAGCSNEPAETGTGTGSSGGNKTPTHHDKAVKFAECMRDNGVREFPDPDAAGEFAYGIERGSSLDPSTANAQGGDIAVHSQRGMGTSFEIRLFRGVV